MPPSSAKRRRKAHRRDAVGVETVEWFVEHEHGRITGEGRGQRQPLAHAEREAADSAVRRGVEIGQLKEARTRAPSLRSPAGRRQLGDGCVRAPGMEALLEDRSDDSRGMGEVAVAAAADRRHAGGRLCQPSRAHMLVVFPGRWRRESGDAARVGDGGEVVEH